MDYTKYPDHCFKIGYFRSSYNSGGINAICQQLGMPDLYDIFKPPEDDYRFEPNWKLALVKCQAAIKKMQKAVENGYNILEAKANMFNSLSELPKNAAEAVAIFEKTRKDSTSGVEGLDFSNKDGEFFLHHPLEVLAIITGTGKYPLKDTSQAVNYIIYKYDFSWYLQALEIVEETILYVLSQRGQQFQLSWSA